jgi:hypothetical protein
MGIFSAPKQTDPKEFWENYETQLGEKVLSFALGQYISGWEEFTGPLWGLLIATDGGFRFHHFPHEGWLQILSRAASGGEAPKEKTLFIPRGRITGAELFVEKSILKKIIFPSAPRLAIRYLDAQGGEKEFLAETEKKAEEIVQRLRGFHKDIVELFRN